MARPFQKRFGGWLDGERSGGGGGSGGAAYALPHRFAWFAITRWVLD